MDNSNLYEKIDQYLDGKLPANDRLAFENEIREDPGLAKEVALYEEVRKHFSNEFLNKENRETLETSLKGLGDEYFQTARSIRPMWQWAGAVAAVIVILVSFYYFFLLTQSFSPEEAYLAYKDSNYSMDVSMGNNPAEIDIQRINILFNDQKYQEALNEYLEYYQTHPERYKVLWAIGICQTELEQYEAAQNTFDALIESDALQEYKLDGRWQKALIYLKLNQIELCKEQLTYILEMPSSQYVNKAQKLFRELR